ncbi:MAG: hypothetical protein GYA15_16020 [Leptolinea sp.]|jgi:hypothetical protein|nr:hypothetical protein [Leptolinea sp.]
MEKTFRVILFLLVIFTFQCGCSPILSQREQHSTSTLAGQSSPVESQATPTALPERKITQVSGALPGSRLPGEPKGSAQIIYDQTCAQTVESKKAPGGDEYSNGRFERPFDKDMKYQPSLDINRSELIRSTDGWNYFTIFLEAQPETSKAVYGIELDLNIDGRGDYLIQAAAPVSNTWEETGIKMWWDSDGDVGGQVINRSDPKGYKGSGFESLRVDTSSGKNTGSIWTRLVGSEIQFALKNELTGGAGGKFTWKPYTDGMGISTTQYDVNDYFLLPAAGSPLLGERDYPLKAVYSLDNTCRGLSGLTPSGSEQGVCPP